MGTGTCHVQLDQENGMIHLSNYVGGSFASYKWDQVSGDILNLAYSEEYGLGSNVKPGRQEFSHAHGVWTFGPFVYLADLGSDKIWHYKVIVAAVHSTLAITVFMLPLEKRLVPMEIWQKLTQLSRRLHRVTVQGTWPSTRI
jgi:6-phosphogluconolactonase (cycloisomerase 2 family)